MRVRALSFHADYRCRSSGACCSSGWEIPVEPDVAARLPALAGGEGALVPRDGLAVLRTLPDGRCVFLRGDGLCDVHACLGEPALPSACRQFPRVVTLTPLGVSVTLSHYCPTAVGLLFAPGDVRIVEAPPAFPPSWGYHGLDAREALPPFLRPSVLMTWPALERWEEHAVAELTRTGAVPESALARLAAVAERARAWRPADGDFDAFLAACLAEDADADRRSSRAADGRRLDEPAVPLESGWSTAAAAVFDRKRLPEPPPSDADAAVLVSAGWRAQAPVVGRWLAARAFASWLALQGDGLRSTVASLHVALGVLRAEAARGCAAAGRPLDAQQLLAALRRADLLLVHLADPEALARAVSRCEAAW